MANRCLGRRFGNFCESHIYGDSLSPYYWDIFKIILFGLGITTFSHTRALKKAIGTDDKRATPYLLEALTMDGVEMRKAAQWALVRCLYALTDDDEDLFDAYQRNILYQQLGTSPVKPIGPSRIQFSEAVLFAIHRTGGAEAIPFVEDFEQRARQMGRAWQKLADLALHALPDLRMRAAKKIIDKKILDTEALSLADHARIVALHDTAVPAESNKQDSAQVRPDASQAN